MDLNHVRAARSDEAQRLRQACVASDFVPSGRVVILMQSKEAGFVPVLSWFRSADGKSDDQSGHESTLAISYSGSM